MARICGLGLFLLVLAIAIGEGLPNPLRQPAPVAIQMLSMLVMTLGLLTAWRWEVTGALATLLGLAAFNVVQLAVSHTLAGGAFALFVIPPMLYLAHAVLVHRGNRRALQ
jgi:hypothetical protein